MENFSESILQIINHVMLRHPSLMDEIAKIYFTNSNASGMEYKLWEARNFSAPSPNFIKQKCLYRNGIPNGIWIETGTYLGATTEYLSKFALEVYSIEPEPTLFKNAELKLKEVKNIKLIHGASEEIFPVLLSKIHGNVNFWLDGHYSEGVTYKGDIDTPIVEELKYIEIHMNQFNKICVMIDDVRCFNSGDEPDNAYPKLHYLVDWARTNNLKWHIEHDIFIAKKD